MSSVFLTVRNKISLEGPTMSQKFLWTMMCIFYLATVIISVPPARAEDQAQLQIINYISTDGKITVYDDNARAVGQKQIDTLPLPVDVLETARGGKLYKIEDNLWVRSMSVQVNHSADLAPTNISILEAKTGRAADEKSHSGRGIK
ncbi:hypothetical protein [Thalassospira indica]|nr:hypothetical protein [Thalassospira indica]OAZ14372.1 hypothetical protein TH15_00710 [Thalassospira profundimaris]